MAPRVQIGEFRSSIHQPQDLVVPIIVSEDLMAAIKENK